MADEKKVAEGSKSTFFLRMLAAKKAKAAGKKGGEEKDKGEGEKKDESVTCACGLPSCPKCQAQNQKLTRGLKSLPPMKEEVEEGAECTGGKKRMRRRLGKAFGAGAEAVKMPTKMTPTAESKEEGETMTTIKEAVKKIVDGGEVDSVVSGVFSEIRGKVVASLKERGLTYNTQYLYYSTPAELKKNIEQRKKGLPPITPAKEDPNLP